MIKVTGSSAAPDASGLYPAASCSTVGSRNNVPPRAP